MFASAFLLILGVAFAALSETGIYTSICGTDGACTITKVDRPPVDQDQWDAYCDYKDTLLKVGWDQLRCKTNPKSEDQNAATALGYLEGHLLAQRIRSHRNNIHTFMLKRYFKADKWPASVIEYIRNNIENTRKKAHELSPTDDRWYGVQLMLWQVDGMRNGANSKEEYKDNQLSEVDYWLYLASGEALDIHSFLNAEARFDWEHATPEEADLWRAISNRCSGLVRLAPGNGDAYIAHTAWFTYASMTRVLKVQEYGWAGKRGQNARRVGFSSYPGFIQSFDDFYVSSEGIAAFETTNSIYDNSLYDRCQPHQLFTMIRAPLAMRMATSGAEWAEVFTKDNSGTYNNQWQVLDYKRLPARNSDAPSGLLIVLEQVPGNMEIRDYTDILMKNGYVPSFNSYLLNTMADVSGQNDAALKSSHAGYYTAPRYKVFRDIIETQNKCRTYDQFRQTIRYNNASNPGQEGSTGNGIAARYDLSDRAMGYGGFDAKSTRLGLMMDPEGPRFDAISGPSRGENNMYPAWQFDDEKYKPGTDSYVPHEGLPEKVDWVFDWVEGFGFEN